MDIEVQNRIYQRIGEFVVLFQWIENKLKEIGWFILDPDRSIWPPTALRDLTNEKLIDEVHRLVMEALPQCQLDVDLQSDITDSFASCIATLHQLRHDRNRILHSAYLELKAGGEVQELLRSDARLKVDDETGGYLIDQEALRPDSFRKQMEEMAQTALVLNKVYMQLIHRYPNGGAEPPNDMDGSAHFE